MAVIQKTLFPKNLDKYAVLINDTQSDSKYFKITELPDTLTGGKNAFLIAGSQYLVPDTKIQIELKDSAGNIVYHEPGEGLISSSVNGESFMAEYYEGVSKVVAVYVYPDTAYGPCTLTILGELSEYQDTNGVTLPVPFDWENKYNVKWQKQIDVNPSLANTTKIRFYRRPTVNITELVEPVYRIESGSKVSSGINQSFANIKISNLETFAGDVKRVKVFRTSLGDISDFSLIQDILVESKELLTTFGLSGSVIGNTGTFTSETLKSFWNTGSLDVQLSNSKVENGIKVNGGGNLTYTSSLDLKSANTYELNLDAFYSASTSSNLGIYLSQVTTSLQNNIEVPITISSSLATLVGTQPTKNLLDTVIPFKLDRNYPSASLYFSQSQGEWHLGNISLRLSQDTAFSPDEVSFITTMPTVIGNEDFNFKFEFYDVNNNYVPVFVTQSANFTGGSNTITKLLTFESDRTAFRFSSGSFANPPNQSVRFKTIRTNFTGSITYASSAFDVGGTYIQPNSYAGTYPGWFTSQNDNGALLNIASFSGSVSSVLVGSIVYTASCEGFQEFETIYRFEDGDNAPGVFVTANTNQFIYKATDLSLNPTGQIITIEAKRKNLASASTPLTINSGSGKPPLTYVSTNTTNGVDTYTISGTSYPYSTNETIYSISGSDQFGNVFSDAIKISPVKILDGFSVATSNENTSFPANSAGSVIGGFAASSGSITVKVGNEVISYASPIANNKFSASISATSGLTANTFNGTNYSINALSQDSGSLTLLVKYQDGGGTIISSSKEVTYSKVKKAAPVLSFVIGNNNQTVTAKSTGAQIDAFVTASLSVIETYDGISSTKTLTASPTTTASNSYTIGNKTTTTIALPNMANGTDSVDITITGSVVDSENTTRLVYGNISLAKSKKAVPNIVITATPQAQSVLANSSGVQTGTLSNVTIEALEGSTSRFTSMTGTYSGFSTNPTISGNILTMTSAVMNAAEASVTLTVTHTDSEGTTGQTKTIVVRTTKVNVGTNGTNGDPGAPGSTGVTGPGVVHTGVWTSGRTYQFSNGLTDGTGRRDTVLWSSSGNAPYNTYYAATRQHLSATGDVINGAPHQPSQTAWTSLGAQDFFVAAKIGIFEDSFVQKTLNIGTNSNGALSSANITLAGGSAYPYISIGQSSTAGEQGYNVNGIFIGVVNVSDSPVYRLSLKSASNSLLWNGTSLTINGGGTFSGDISAATGTFTGGVSGTGYSLNNSGLSLTNAGSSISLGNGVTLNSSGLSGTGFSLTTTGVVASAGAIAGWTIDGTNGLQKTTGNYILKLNSSGTKISITKTNPIDSLDVVLLDASETIPQIIPSDTGFINYTNNGGAVVDVAYQGTPVYANTGFVLGSSGGYDYGYGWGIIGLQYATEEISIDSETFPSLLEVIDSQVYTGNSSAVYECILRVRRFPTATDAVNQTNMNTSYGEKEVLVAKAEFGSIAGNIYENSRQVYGATIAAAGQGGINTPGNANWYRVEIYQYWRGEISGGDAFDTIVLRRPPSDIQVRFGRIGNGYSTFSPGGLQVYQGFRNYMNVSTPSGSTGVASNFCLIKGKSQIIGSLDVTSGLSAGNKQFKIKHPVNENKWLYHTSIEAPRADLIYRGHIQLENGSGSCLIDSSSRMSDGTFESLTKNSQLFLQNENGFDKVRGNVMSGSISVISENINSNDVISWMVVAERRDKDILNSALYDSNGNYKPERYTSEYLEIFKKELFVNISGSI